MSGRIGFCLLFFFFFNYGGRRLVRLLLYHQESNLWKGMSREIKFTGTFPKLQNRIQEYLVFSLFDGRKRFLQWVGEQRVSFSLGNPSATKWAHMREVMFLCASLWPCYCVTGSWESVYRLHCHFTSVCTFPGQASLQEPQGTCKPVGRKVFSGVTVMFNITMEELRSGPGGKLSHYKNVLINQNSCCRNSQS